MGFCMSAHTPSSNSAPYKLLRLYAQAEGISTTIDFALPNRRYEQIHAGKYWFSSLTTVTPVTAQRCRIDVVAAWNIFRHVPLVLPIFRFFGKKFMGQDQRTMEMQAGDVLRAERAFVRRAARRVTAVVERGRRRG